MREVRRSIGGTVLFAYVAMIIASELADILVADWRLHQLAWTVLVPILTNIGIFASLVVANVIPLRHPAPRYFVALMLILAVAWQGYAIFLDIKAAKMIQVEIIPGISLNIFLAVVMCLPISFKICRATPFFEASWEDPPV